MQSLQLTNTLGMFKFKLIGSRLYDVIINCSNMAIKGERELIPTALPVLQFLAQIFRLSIKSK